MLSFPFVSFLPALGCFKQCSPSWQAAWPAELWAYETGLEETERLHVFGQFGSERPAAMWAAGRALLDASCGNQAFAPRVLVSASRQFFAA